jgi:hypothetical protein
VEVVEMQELPQSKKKQQPLLEAWRHLIQRTRYQTTFKDVMATLKCGWYNRDEKKKEWGGIES